MAKNEITDALDRISRRLATTKKRFQIAMRGRVGRIALRTLAKLKTMPGSPMYPIRWTTPKQMRAFWATDGFGRGIPTERTGEVLEGWDVEVANLPNGVLVGLTNPVPYTQYVQGMNVQGFHLDTGYVQVGDVEDDFYAEVEDDVVLTTFYEVADPLGDL